MKSMALCTKLEKIVAVVNKKLQCVWKITAFFAVSWVVHNGLYNQTSKRAHGCHYRCGTFAGIQIGVSACYTQSGCYTEGSFNQKIAKIFRPFLQEHPCKVGVSIRPFSLQIVRLVSIQHHHGSCKVESNLWWLSFFCKRVK